MSPPEIRETDSLPPQVPAVALVEEGGKVVVWVLTSLAAAERKAAVREAMRVLHGRRRGRRGLVLIPAAGAVRLVTHHPAQAITATVAAVSAGAVVYGGVPPLRLPSGPAPAPPAVTRIAPHVKRSRHPYADRVPVPQRTAGLILQPSSSPSPRLSPHRSPSPSPGASPSPSASPFPSGPFPVPTVPVTWTAAASYAPATPSPGASPAPVPSCIAVVGIRVCLPLSTQL